MSQCKHDKGLINKLDGGKLPQICVVCREIVGWGKLPTKDKK